MTTKLNIKDRKNTTEKALEELQNLIDSFEEKFEDDIDTVTSEIFFGKIEVDNGQMYGDMHYSDWYNTEAYWRIKNGKLELLSIDDLEYWDRQRAYKAKDFQQINFARCIKSLEEVIQKYNEASAKKETQIEKFLSFCSDFFEDRSTSATTTKE